MTNAETKTQVELENLSSILFSTLDEKVFFAHLSRYFQGHFQVDRVKAYIIHQDKRAELVSIDGEVLEESHMINKGVGPVGHVARTRKPYFSNSVERDPLFEREAEEGIKREISLPVAHEGIVIATIHLQMLDESIEFSRDHITEALSILDQIKTPIANMKMYLSAKFLNEALMKQIEDKEKELEEKKGGINISSSYRIEDKEIVGQSESMKKLLHLIDKLAHSQANALLYGESGTGKQMIARKIHCRSDRKDHGFISFDCAAMDQQQIEKELFGEEIYDAANGAIVRNGLLEKANSGTLFLNNIEKLPLTVQAKLASFLHDRMVFRVGGHLPYRADVRLVGASSRHMEEEVEKGQFREDLYYSLGTVKLSIPSLRERREDIETLANHFVNRGKPVEEQKSLSPCAMKKLLEYNWPGNVRELQSVMERAFILSEGKIIEIEHLADSVQYCQEEEKEVEQEEVINFHEMTLDELERKHICLTLEHLGGNKTKTAKTLGITVKTLYNKLHSYGMISQKEA